MVHTSPRLSRSFYGILFNTRGEAEPLNIAEFRVGVSSIYYWDVLFYLIWLFHVEEVGSRYLRKVP